jgi:hypothetical protein
MHKEAGVCVDAPFFDFFDGEFENGVKEQNHLSLDASKGLLEGIFGMNGNPDVPGHGFGRNGVVLNGHDHEGCNVYHYINQSQPLEREWQATQWSHALSNGIPEEPGVPGLREITVRSMMGDFAGNAGLLSLWFDEQEWDWKFEFTNCGLGTQHIWWATHIIDLITLGVGIVYGCLVLVQSVLSSLSPSGKHSTPKVDKSKSGEKGKGSEYVTRGNGEKRGSIANGHSHLPGDAMGNLRNAGDKISTSGGIKI